MAEASGACLHRSRCERRRRPGDADRGGRRARGPPGARLRGVSRLYRTAPVGDTDQPEFTNAVVALDVPAGPDPATGALGTARRSSRPWSASFGRQPRRRWGPRELDLDLLIFGRARARRRTAARRPLARRRRSTRPRHRSSSRSRIRRRGARLFVLAPLADLAPRLVAARLGRDGRDRPPSPGRDRRATTPSGPSRPGTRRRALAPEPSGSDGPGNASAGPVSMAPPPGARSTRYAAGARA